MPMHSKSGIPKSSLQSGYTVTAWYIGDSARIVIL